MVHCQLLTAVQRSTCVCTDLDHDPPIHMPMVIFGSRSAFRYMSACMVDRDPPSKCTSSCVGSRSTVRCIVRVGSRPTGRLVHNQYWLTTYRPAVYNDTVVRNPPIDIYVTRCGSQSNFMHVHCHNWIAIHRSTHVCNHSSCAYIELDRDPNSDIYACRFGS